MNLKYEGYDGFAIFRIVWKFFFVKSVLSERPHSHLVSTGEREETSCNRRTTRVSDESSETRQSHEKIAQFICNLPGRHFVIIVKPTQLPTS